CMPIPINNRFSVFRQRLQLFKYSLPVHRTQNDRNNPCFSSFMPFYCSLHLKAITVIRVHEVRAHKEQHNLGSVQMILNLLFPFCSSTNFTIMPDIDKTLSL